VEQTWSYWTLLVKHLSWSVAVIVLALRQIHVHWLHIMLYYWWQLAVITHIKKKNSTLNPLTPLLGICCRMGTSIKHAVPDRVKTSFAIFDIRTLWRSVLSILVPGWKSKIVRHARQIASPFRDLSLSMFWNVHSVSALVGQHVWTKEAFGFDCVIMSRHCIACETLSQFHR